MTKKGNIDLSKIESLTRVRNYLVSFMGHDQIPQRILREALGINPRNKVHISILAKGAIFLST